MGDLKDKLRVKSGWAIGVMAEFNNLIFVNTYWHKALKGIG